MKIKCKKNISKTYFIGIHKEKACKNLTIKSKSRNFSI